MGTLAQAKCKKRYLDNHPEKRKQFQERQRKYHRSEENKKRVNEISAERRKIIKNQPFQTVEEYIAYLEEV